MLKHLNYIYGVLNIYVFVSKCIYMLIAVCPNELPP